MVGFPTTLPVSIYSTVEVVDHLVPEASVIQYELLDPSKDLIPESGEYGTVVSLPVDWIFTEARSLLKKMRETTPKGGEIILSGYGLGGIVAKQVCSSQNSGHRSLAEVKENHDADRWL